MDPNVEKRQHPRHEFMSAIMITPNGDQHDAQVLDLSAGGVRVGLSHDWVPKDGAAVRMFFLAGTDSAITLEGHVTRVAVDHLGVAFDPTQEGSVRQLLTAVGKAH